MNAAELRANSISAIKKRSDRYDKKEFLGNGLSYWRWTCLRRLRYSPFLLLLWMLGRKNTAPPFPQDVRVTWYRLKVLESIKKENDKLTLNVKAGSRAYKLYLSFPKEGGFRLY